MKPNLKDAVVRLLVERHGWNQTCAIQAVDAARVCVDGVKLEDLPAVLADVINAQYEEAENAD